MLYISGRKSSRIQNVLHSIYFECNDIKNSINQYYKCIDMKHEIISYIADNDPSLFSALIDSLKYRIIVGMGILFDNDRQGLSINKLLNLCSNENNKELKEMVKKYINDFNKYNNLKSQIKEFRDKMFAHIDIKYSLENNDIYDIDYDILHAVIKESDDALEYFKNMCVELSLKLDNDSLCLHINRMYDK